MDISDRIAMENILREDLDHILEHTQGLWEEVRGGRIFITGGTGFFGCWLLESFAWANARLNLNASAVVLSRNPEAFGRKAPHLYSNHAIQFHTGDVRSFKFPEGTFSHIIHAAKVADSSAPEDPLLLFEGIVKGTRHMLEFARHCSAKKLLFTSSGAVYGKQPPELTHIGEDYAGAPDPMSSASAYGEGKRVSEFLAAAYARRYGFEAKISRCFAFVGPHLPLDINFAIGNFIDNAIKNEQILVRGDGTPYRSYLYAADLAIWLWTILFRGTSCRPYNVGSDNGFTIADIARTVAVVAGTKQSVQVLQEAAPGKAAERYVPSVQRARHDLGLKQDIGLQEAIRRTISWYLNR